jgi:hypothetical protein
MIRLFLPLAFLVTALMAIGWGAALVDCQSTTEDLSCTPNSRMLPSVPGGQVLSGGSLGRSSRRFCDQDYLLPPTSRTLECMFLTASDWFDADQPQRAAALGTKRAVVGFG